MYLATAQIRYGFGFSSKQILHQWHIHVGCIRVDIDHTHTESFHG